MAAKTEGDGRLAGSKRTLRTGSNIVSRVSVYHFVQNCGINLSLGDMNRHPLTSDMALMTE